MTRPIQRVGHIGDGDNRFCGEAVFAELAGRVTEPIEIAALAFGVHSLDATDRDVLRCLALAVVSPDARVWPLKLTRVLASYGSAAAGHYGAQLTVCGERMGPGTATLACTSLAWIAAQVAEGASVEAAVRRHLDERGRIAGFGVPMREQDERRVGLLALLADHPACTRPMWRLHEQVIAAVPMTPNVVSPIAALLLDIGVPPRRAGMFLAMLMTPTFIAHALEAADQDGPHLRTLPPAAIEYRGRPARPLP